MTQRVPPRKRKGTLSTSEIKQQQVVKLRGAGASQRAISREVGLARHTVKRILSQGEYQLMVQRGRSQLAELVPRATGVLAYFLKRKKKSDGQGCRRGYRHPQWAAGLRAEEPDRHRGSAAK